MSGEGPEGYTPHRHPLTPPDPTPAPGDLLQVTFSSPYPLSAAVNKSPPVSRVL